MIEIWWDGNCVDVERRFRDYKDCERMFTDTIFDYPCPCIDRTLYLADCYSLVFSYFNS